MPHPLVNKHGKSGAEQNATRAALNENQYESSIYVGRRKVWSTRAATERDAFTQAEAQKTKYGAANPEIKVKRVKVSER
jgi:hypothetical protein